MQQTNPSYYRAYAQATQTVAKTRQIVMLYDGAIRNLRQAKEAILSKKYDDRYNLLSKVSDILTGLQSSLDFEKGGQVAETLYEFYGSLDAKVRGLHRTNHAESCDRIAEELKEMRDAWNAVDLQQSGQKPSASPIAIDPEIANTPAMHGRAVAQNTITA